MTTFSVVIPVYNACDCLKPLYERLTAVLSLLCPSFEIIFIEDCSSDNSWQVLKDLVQQDPSVKAYRLSRNFGQHAAITAGLSKANGQWAIVMDCDLQDPPEEIPRLLEKAKEGYEVVLAKRTVKKLSLFRQWASILYFKLLSSSTETPIRPEYGSFSLISRKVIDAYLSMKEQNRHYLFILYWLGFPTASIEYHQAERYAGKSSYTLHQLVHHALQGVFFQTTKILQWITYLGFLCSLSGLTLAFIFIYRYFMQAILPGWTSLAVLILVMGGMTLISLGIVGLYIGKIFDQVKDRPIFVIAAEAEHPKIL